MTHYCYEMLKGYAALQRFTPKRDPRSIEINCEDDLIRHYDRGRGDTYAGVLQERYLTEDNSTCLRPPSAGVGEPPSPFRLLRALRESRRAPRCSRRRLVRRGGVAPSTAPSRRASHRTTSRPKRRWGSATRARRSTRAPGGMTGEEEPRGGRHRSTHALTLLPRRL